MKKRILALLMALCLGCAALMPATAAGGNAAVQAAVMLSGVDAGQDGAAALTRGQLARLLVAFSPYRESAAAQGSVGTLFTDVPGADALAPYIRIAVQQGWMTGYTDGSFRPASPVTLEEGCAAALNLLGYDVTTLSGTFPDAQLNKAAELGLRAGVACAPGQGLTVEQGAMLLYNALTAATPEGESYGASIGFTVTDGRLEMSSVLLGSLEGPYVAGEGAQLPFVPAAFYRNGALSAETALQPYDVYYYNANARTVWVSSRRAAGRITAVSPSAAAPASVTVAGVEYTVGTSEAAAVLSSLNGGGVGQVVTLLLGMEDEVVRVLTGAQADQVFYGVVQASSRSLTETNGADVLQNVTVACTDGVTRTVQVDKSLNYPAGWLVQITVDENGEQIEQIDEKHTGGVFDAGSSTLGGAALAEDVEILDTAGDGMAGRVQPARLDGANLSDGDVRYYTTNAAGEIDRLILDNVTGDLWTYGLLDDTRRLTDAAAGAIDDALEDGDSAAPAQTAGSIGDLADSILPSTSDILYGIIDGSILSLFGESLTGGSGNIASWLLSKASDSTSGALSDVLGWLGDGASYVCYIDGENTTLNTAVKYPVVAGGVAVGQNAAGTVTSMMQLVPVMIDRLGAASVMSGDTRYETADDMQVYLWYRGQYFPTTLSQVDPENYYLIGWRDQLGCAAGGRIRVLVAVKKD